ncbi:MAG: Sulfatase family protein [uncultured Sulfurovum sp.]|uniref:Sulfatase family protein n=1 Tax=uncultured Sulfurovum sp. TaxID=269237 RepID=A0A6S6SJ74_9BACT|nr:MAG: Sulfatase family protein [uncultured Sulfurovum sp.]
MYRTLPKLIRFLLILTFWEVLVFTLFRLAFFMAFKDYGTDYTSGDVVYSFWLGFRFDLQLALIANLPIFLLGGIKYIGIFKSTFAKYFWISYIFVVNTVFILLYVIDFPYFDFFKKMVDSSIIRYFYDIGEAFKMLAEGYPLVPTIIGTIVALIIFFMLIRGLVNSINSSAKDYFRSSTHKITLYSIFFVFYIFGGYGKFEWYPWRWSEAFYSSNSFLSYLASNPVTYFKNTLKNSDVKYDLNATMAYYPYMVNYLEIDPKDDNNVSLLRVIEDNQNELYRFKQPNVVFILGESTSYARSSISGNPLNPTPFLKKMSDKGLTYSRFYTPHSGTARSVWTAMTGLPDVERMKTSSRNPMAVQEHMILNAFKGYEKFYFIGGSLSWGNVRGVVGNVNDLHTFEEHDYKNSPHNDVWGISDVHLANEVNAVLKTQNKPFFAFVQLSGNHSPNNIPEENFGFEFPKEVDEGLLSKYGFKGAINELEGQMFLDHSVKRLITLAKKESYFKNTIFIFIGDHGLPNRADHMHEAEQTFETHTLHTPLIIYAPELIEHKKIDYPVSEVDMMATIGGLIGEPYMNASIGRNILAKDFDKKQHYAFYLTHEENFRLNLIGKEYIFRIRANGEDRGLFKYHYDKKDENLINKYPKLAKEMEGICRGIFESTRYTRFHNAPKNIQQRLKSMSKDN